MRKTGDPDTSEIATPKRVRTYRPKHSDTSLSCEWRINIAKKNIEQFLQSNCALHREASIKQLKAMKLT